MKAKIVIWLALTYFCTNAYHCCMYVFLCHLLCSCATALHYSMKSSFKKTSKPNKFFGGQESVLKRFQKFSKIRPYRTSLPLYKSAIQKPFQTFQSWKLQKRNHPLAVAHLNVFLIRVFSQNS